MQQTGGTQDSAMTTDNIEHHHQDQHPHYHHRHHLHHHQHHRHHNDNDEDKDGDDDDRLSGAGDDYEQQVESDDNSSYASRALRRFTARATSGVLDGRVTLRTAADDWQHTGTGGPDNHIVYSTSATAATSINDDVSFSGRINNRIIFY